MEDPHFMTRVEGKVSGLASEAARLAPWFHNLHLPDGSQTSPEHPLGDFPACKWMQIESHIPEDLSGWSVLDIGCNAGFYSFELARRGAQVTALEPDSHFLTQARWAARILRLERQIEFREGNVYDIAQDSEAFDLVIFMGVFYHLRYPLLGLDIVASKTRRLLVFQTLTMPGDAVNDTPEDLAFDERSALTLPGWPKMAFIENSLAGDPTNWWAPNHAGVEAMLRSAGVEVIRRPGHEIYLCAPATSSLEKAIAPNRAALYAATRHLAADSS